MSDQPTVQFPALPESPRPRRTGWRAPLIAALVTLVLTLPLAVYLIMRGGPGGDNGAAPGLSPSSSPPASTAPSPGTSATTSPKPTAPDGHIALSTLRNATLRIPPWPADNVQGPSGRLRFRDGVVPIDEPRNPSAHRPPTGSQVAILSVTYGDVDRDGAEETIAEIGCMIEEGSKQLIAFDRDRAGRIVTMGVVVATTGAIREITDARVTEAGTVTARVGDYQVCCDDHTPQTWQSRGYRWRHGRFAQVSGPTRMAASPYVTETALTAGELVLGPAVDGYRYGTLAVTLRHRWGTRPAHVLIEFFPSTGLERAGTAWPPIITTPASPWFRVSVAAPPVHGTVTHRFAFRRPASASAGTLDVEAIGTNRQGTSMSEAIGWNNGDTATIRTVD